MSRWVAVILITPAVVNLLTGRDVVASVGFIALVLAVYFALAAEYRR